MECAENGLRFGFGIISSRFFVSYGLGEIRITQNFLICNFYRITFPYYCWINGLAFEICNLDSLLFFLYFIRLLCKNAIENGSLSRHHSKLRIAIAVSMKFTTMIDANLNCDCNLKIPQRTMPVDIKATMRRKRDFERVQLELGMEYVNVCYFIAIKLIHHRLKTDEGKRSAIFHSLIDHWNHKNNNWPHQSHSQFNFNDELDLNIDLAPPAPTRNEKPIELMLRLRSFYIKVNRTWNGIWIINRQIAFVNNLWVIRLNFDWEKVGNCYFNHCLWFTGYSMPHYSFYGFS